MRRVKTKSMGIGKAKVGRGMSGNAVPKPIAKAGGAKRTGTSSVANTRRPTGARLR